MFDRRNGPRLVVSVPRFYFSGQDQDGVGFVQWRVGIYVALNLMVDGRSSRTDDLPTTEHRALRGGMDSFQGSFISSINGNNFLMSEWLKNP